MYPKSIIFGIIFIAAAALLITNIRKLIKKIKTGAPEDRTSEPIKRFRHMLTVAFAQTKILREQTAGILHVTIFWGFLVLLFSASEAVIQGFFNDFSWRFLGPVYTLITLSNDIFSFAIMIAILFSLYRRFIAKVPRLQGDAAEKKDAAIVLLSIFTICLSLFIQNAALGRTEPYDLFAFRPISSILSPMFGLRSAQYIYEITWWVHILAILYFINYLPFSKHLHVYTSIPNVYFSSLEFPGTLKPIDFEREGVEKFGIVDIDDLSWKNLLDSYSCTHCGRCASVCPANNTGKELSPREIIVQIRRRTDEAAFVIQKNKALSAVSTESHSEPAMSEAEQSILNKKFIGDYESVEALWQCTTCGACMQECPISIEHVPAIIGMRRSLVMMESNFPQEIQPAFSNLETNATPWAFSAAERGDWAEGTGVRTAAEYPDFEYLFWVGCAGSFDDRAKKISLATALLMQKAGINFAILGSEEQCTGDFARRTGNEYLADMLVKANIETFNRYNVKKIITFCPHCYNTLKNEYPMFGGNYELFHHSEILLDAINRGSLKLKNDTKTSINAAYHDSCYLGRYNHLYEPPRRVLKSIPGLTLLEPERHGDRAFCCGAGGGQMFMEETVGKRVNIERTEELLETGASLLALNCPFCMTMLTDGVKAKDLVDSVTVKDIAEIIADYVE